MTDNPFSFESELQHNLSRLADEHYQAKCAQRELEQMKKVVWLLLKQIGEPVTVDASSLLDVPCDYQIYETREPRQEYVTLRAH